jgi:hypothetical protein
MKSICGQRNDNQEITRKNQSIGRKMKKITLSVPL